MNTEENKNQTEVTGINENEINLTEEALPQGHAADIGEPEEKKVEPQPVTEEEKLRQEVSEWKDKYMRLFAEFDNFRKRNAKERLELMASASGDVIKDLLPVLDDFERATKANEGLEDITVVKEGFDLIFKRLSRQLENRGLKPILSTFQPFDVDYHEAVANVPATSDTLKGTVLDTVEKGYMLHDKVIRFAKVVVNV